MRGLTSIAKCLGIFLLSSVLSSANAAGSDCSALFDLSEEAKAAELRLIGIAAFEDVLASHGVNIKLLKESLHPQHFAWIKAIYNKLWALNYNAEIRNALGVKGQILRPPGEPLFAAGKTYKIIAWLGFGGEGAVYLVHSAVGLQVVKMFYKAENAAKQIDGLKRIESPTAKVIASDLEEGILIFDYLEGIPVTEIKHRFRELGISERDAGEIVRRFESLQLKAGTGKSADEKNVIYSFKTNSFSTIDSQ